MSVRCLLDTCTFLWTLEGSRKLTSRVRRQIENPENRVLFSAVSAWEIAVKHAAGRLPLPGSVDDFIGEGRSGHGLEALVFDARCTYHLHRLPHVHRDPFDWMLICQAIEHDLTILTPDPMIRKYPIKTLW